MKPCIRCGHAIENHVEYCPQCEASQVVPPVAEDVSRSQHEPAEDRSAGERLLRAVVWYVVIPIATCAISYYTHGVDGFIAGAIGVMVLHFIVGFLQSDASSLV